MVVTVTMRGRQWHHTYFAMHNSTHTPNPSKLKTLLNKSPPHKGVVNSPTNMTAPMGIQREDKWIEEKNIQYLNSIWGFTLPESIKDGVNDVRSCNFRILFIHQQLGTKSGIKMFKKNWSIGEKDANWFCKKGGTRLLSFYNFLWSRGEICVANFGPLRLLLIRANIYLDIYMISILIF